MRVTNCKGQEVEVAIDPSLVFAGEENSYQTPDGQVHKYLMPVTLVDDGSGIVRKWSFADGQVPQGWYVLSWGWHKADLPDRLVRKGRKEFYTPRRLFRLAFLDEAAIEPIKRNHWVVHDPQANKEELWKVIRLGWGMYFVRSRKMTNR
jgi:hypothetical protein